MAKIAMSTVSMSATKMAVEAAPTYKLAATPTKVAAPESYAKIEKIAISPSIADKYFTPGKAFMDGDGPSGDFDSPYLWGSKETITVGGYTDGMDRLDGTNGNDVMFGAGGIDNLSGGKGDDHIYGGRDKDYLYGQDGDDRLFGGSGNDQLHGGEGNDTLVPGTNTGTYNGMNQSATDSADYVDGGNGDDYIVINGDDGTMLTSEANGGLSGSYIARGGNGYDAFDVYGGKFVELTGDDGTQYRDDFIFQESFHGTAVITDFRGAMGDRIVIANRDGDYDFNQNGQDWTIHNGSYKGQASAIIDLHGGGQVIIQGVTVEQMGNLNYGSGTYDPWVV